MGRLRTERGLDRLVNFSDATVAIAMTLLVLPLVDLAGSIGNERFLPFIEDHSGTFVAFFVSFAVIARFWLEHHRLFELVADYSTLLLWWDLLWLLGIVFLPFATNVISDVPSHNGSMYAAYICTIAAISFAGLLLNIELVRHPELQRDGAREHLALGPAIAPIVLMLVAAVLADVVPRVGLLWLLLLVLESPLLGLVRRIPGPIGRAARGTQGAQGAQGTRERSR